MIELPFRAARLRGGVLSVSKAEHRNQLAMLVAASNVSDGVCLRCWRVSTVIAAYAWGPITAALRCFEG